MNSGRWWSLLPSYELTTYDDRLALSLTCQVWLDADKVWPRNNHLGAQAAADVPLSARLQKHPTLSNSQFSPRIPVSLYRAGGRLFAPSTEQQQSHYSYAIIACLLAALTPDVVIKLPDMAMLLSIASCPPGLSTLECNKLQNMPSLLSSMHVNIADYCRPRHCN